MPIDPAKPFDLEFRVDPNWVDMRLDHFVKAMIPSMSRTKIQKYIKAKRVEVAGAPRPANWRVRLDESVVIRCNIPEEGADVGRYIPIHTLYEDEDIAAVNKQAGLVVHPVSLHRHDTLLNALYFRYKDILPPEQEVSLGNRLDQYTSGVILVAKHTQAKQHLQDQFEYRRTRKAYLALCEGLVEPDAAEIDLPIGPALGRKDRCKMGVRHDELGKPSRTAMRVLERFPVGPGFTLVRLEPHTGRQHQLRVHMAALGHALVCDDRYGDADALVCGAGAEGSTRDGAGAAVARENPDGSQGREAVLARYALHAEELTFRHPRTETEQTITAPLAEDLAEVVERLRAGCAVTRRPEPLPTVALLPGAGGAGGASE